MINTHNSPVSRRKWFGLASASTIAASIGPRLASTAAPAAEPQTLATGASPGARVFDVRAFGAIGDGKTPDTASVQAAIDACHADRGGTVLVPAGIFVIGTVELKSNVTLHIAAQGTLLGTTDAKQYHAADKIPLSGDSTLEDGNVGLLFATNAENITIEGPGTIDGQGLQFHSPQKGLPSPVGLKSHERPYHLLFYQCENIRVRDLFLKDGAYHSIRMIQSHYVWFTGLRIHSRVNGNNDGFHFISTTHIHISDCSIECQDDACALFGSCQNVTVTNCEFSTRWSVFRFGGGHAKDIAVSNCLIYETFGCPIKLHCGPTSRFERMSFSNLVMRDVTGPISIGVGPSRQWRHNALSRGQTNAPAGGTNNVSPTAAGITNDKIPAVPDPEELAMPPGICRNISFNGIHAIVSKPVPLPDTPVQSDYNPAEIFSCIALNGVAPGFLENISFNDVHVIFPGGGTAGHGANRDVPKIADEYFRNGVLPAYALYARNVRGLTLHNVRFEIAAPDLRPAMVLERVTDAAINGLNVQGAENAESVLRFMDCSNVLMSATRLLGPAPVFLRVEGSASEGIILDGGDLSRAGKPVGFAAGAEEKAVRARLY